MQSREIGESKKLIDFMEKQADALPQPCRFETYIISQRRNEYVRKKDVPTLNRAVIAAALTFAVAVLMAASDCFLKNKKE